MRPTFLPGTHECPGLVGVWSECPLPAVDEPAAPLIIAAVVLVAVVLYVVASLVLLHHSMTE